MRFASDRAHRLMAGYVGVVIPLTVVYLTMPSKHTVTWAFIGLGSVGAILWGIRLNRPAHAWPWWMLAAANLAFTAGDTTYNVLNRFFAEQNPFPSLADVFYLATYPLFAAGLLGFIRYRVTGRDLGTLLDAMILTTGLALLSWTWLIMPNSHAAGMTWEQRAISMAYPLGDVLMLAMLARLLTPGPVRPPAIRLLTLGTVGILVSDVLYGLLQLKGTWRVGTPMDLGWVVFFTAWGLAALHPSMAQLTQRAPARHPGIRPRLLVVLALASMIAPGLLLYESAVGSVHDTAVIALFSAVLFLLVLARLSSLVAVYLKALTRERGLRAAAASLVAAAGHKDIAQAVERAGDTLFAPGEPHRTALLLADSGGARLTAVGTRTRSRDWHLDTGRAPPDGWLPKLLAHQAQAVPVDDLGTSAASELIGLPYALLCPLAVRDRADGAALTGALVCAGTEKSLAERWGSFETLAAQTALAVERVELDAEINRRNSEAYFRTLVHNASDVILILDDDGTVRYASPSAEGMFGRGRLTGVRLAECVAPADHDRAMRVLERMRASDDLQDSRDDWRMLGGAGVPIDVEVRCSNLRHDRTVHGLVLTLRDVTEQRQLERELTRRAFHDPLTGLPNRMLLVERIERALLRGSRDSTPTCVLFVDLDDFKVVNDTRGHSVGDELLVSVARRLTATLRPSDTAARLGGDEFAVLMEGGTQPADAESLAAQIIRSLAEPFRLSGGTISVSASVGIASTVDSATGEELIGHSDLALYAAKTAGKRQWRRYRADLANGVLERHQLREKLESAISDRAFALRYQPIVEIGTGEVTGFEALARWPHTGRSAVPPHQFIALAEETGHIKPLGAWVLEHAAAHAAHWQQVAPRPDPLKINVNVSAHQFRDPAFLDEVRKVLDSSGLAPGSLVLELTETVLMQRDERIHSMLATLKDLGVSMAIDDFGTGFSSLSYLREFPVDLLKVDKSFIDDIAVDRRQVRLVEGIVRIADTLGLQVIAEGIEQTGQRDRLAAMGCRFGQGYLFAGPLTADQGEHLLRTLGAGSGRRNGAPADHRPDRTRRPAAAAPGPPPEAATATGTQEVQVSEASANGAGHGHERWTELDRLRTSSPMSDAVIDEVRGRHIRSQGHWLIDFASCNYLGFDLEPEIMAAIDPQVRRWGTHPSWSRLLGSPRLYPQIEERLTALLHAPDTLLLPTITLIHAAVIPLLAGQGHILVEARAHRTVYDACLVARGQGATVRRFHADRPGELRAMLDATPAGTARLVCLDGADSMTGNLPDLPRIADICREHDALVYVDDAHGFGVIGERHAAELSPYGCRGNGIVRYYGESYDNIVLVAGFSKAYSSLLAFLALPTRLKNHLKVAAAPYLYSGPSPTASLATALAGLDVNDRRGDTIRADLHRKTRRVLDRLDLLGVRTPSRCGLPIIEIPLAEPADLDAVALYLWERGIYVTLAAYPLVPHDRVGIRLQITAGNTDDDIDRLTETLSAVDERFALRHAARA